MVDRRRPTVVVVIFASLAAFVFARMRVSAVARRCTPCSCSGCCFPAAVAILPLYILVRDLGPARTTRSASPCPQAAFGLPLTIIILRPFFRSIPIELEDAAAIDGCGPFGFFWRVLLPLSRPALATVAVLAIVRQLERVPAAARRSSNGADQWTLPLGVMNFSTQYSSDTARILAYTTLVADPGARLLRHRRAPARRRPDRGSR